MISNLIRISNEYRFGFPFYNDIFSRMPQGFPEYNLKADYDTQKKQGNVMMAWYEKNEHRLAWDEKKRKYYLKPEKETGK